jgi:hypothetical protein
MSYTIKGDCTASEHAARFTRDKYSIPFDETIVPKFEAEFNCILDFGKDKPDAYMYPDWIQFETEQEKVMFLLRFT